MDASPNPMRQHAVSPTDLRLSFVVAFFLFEVLPLLFHRVRFHGKGSAVRQRCTCCHGFGAWVMRRIRNVVYI